MAGTDGIDEELLEDLYTWIDEIPLSRPKKDIRRDFSDGVMVAEIVRHYFPRLVDLHNYPSANKIASKITNWNTLNWKIFRKLGFELGDDVIRNVCSFHPWAVEQVLIIMRRKIDRALFEQKRQPAPDSDRPEADQKVKEVTKQPKQSKLPASKHPPLTREGSYLRLSQQNPSHGAIPVSQSNAPTKHYKGEMVSKILLEEKEQELLAKEETIQILNAKVRRLEHLLNLKDIRIDDMQLKIDNLEKRLRPTAQYGPPRR